MFTTYQRDSESSNDYAQARYFRWLVGRFTTLDPMAGSIGDPQSQNRYSYVRNNPVNLTDPSGRCPGWGPFAVNDKLICGTSGLKLGLEMGIVGQNYSLDTSGYCGPQYSSCISTNPVFNGSPGTPGDPRCGINTACIVNGYNPLNSPQADPNNPIYFQTDDPTGHIIIIINCDEGPGGPEDSICSIDPSSQQYVVNGQKQYYLGHVDRPVQSGVADEQKMRAVFGQTVRLAQGPLNVMSVAFTLEVGGIMAIEAAPVLVDAGADLVDTANQAVSPYIETPAGRFVLQRLYIGQYYSVPVVSTVWNWIRNHW